MRAQIRVSNWWVPGSLLLNRLVFSEDCGDNEAHGGFLGSAPRKAGERDRPPSEFRESDESYKSNKYGSLYENERQIWNI